MEPGVIFSTIGTVNSENTDGTNNRICCSELYCLSGRKGITEAKDLWWVELSDAPGCRHGIQIHWETGPTLCDSGWEDLDYDTRNPCMLGTVQIAHAHLFKRGWASTPGVTHIQLVKGDSASALPHHLPFQVCFERASRCLVFVGLSY